MTSDILQHRRHNLNNWELAITPQILNEALILVEDQLLKISGKMMSDFDIESPTRIEELDRQFNFFRTGIILQKQRMMPTNFHFSFKKMNKN